MTDTTTEVLLELNKPTKTGRIYDLTSIDTIRLPMLGTLDFDSNSSLVDLGKVAFMVDNIRINGEQVLGDVKVLNTPFGNIAKTMLAIEGLTEYAVGGHGDISEDGVVTNFKLTHVALINK